MMFVTHATPAGGIVQSNPTINRRANHPESPHGFHRRIVQIDLVSAGAALGAKAVFKPTKEFHINRIPPHAVTCSPLYWISNCGLTIPVQPLTLIFQRYRKIRV